MNSLKSIRLLPIFVILMSACSASHRPIPVPTTITTVAAGYPYALQVKNQMTDNAHLTIVLVDVDSEGDQLHIAQITYGFASPKPDDRVFGIMVDNLKHEARAAFIAPNSPDKPFATASRSTPLDLSGITNDISRILAIAKPHGLDEFRLLVPPQYANLSLALFNSDAGTVWSITGDGWDEKGPIADLFITVDAKTGTVLKHSLDKAVNR